VNAWQGGLDGCIPAFLFVIAAFYLKITKTLEVNGLHHPAPTKIKGTCAMLASWCTYTCRNMVVLGNAYVS
jgi:hypothetical protein